MKKISNIPDFQKLFEASPDVYIVLSPDFKIVAATEERLKATKTKRDEIIGRELFEVFPDNPNDPNATGVTNLKASLNRVLENKIADAMAPQKYDIPRPESEGGGFEERYWSPLNSPVFDENGELIYIIHRVEDITEFMLLKKKGTELETRTERMESEIFLRAQQLQEANKKLRDVQATLQLSEEKYRKIVEETGDAVYSSDYKGYFTYVNPVCKKLTGYTENELLGMHFLELVAPDWKEKVAKFYKEQFENKVQETSFSFPIITKSGEKKWVEQTVSQLKEGDLITGHNTIVRDITERKKAEEKLKEYQYFFNNSHDLMTIASESHFEIINPNFQKMLGYSEKELLEKRFLDFIHPDDLNATIQEIEKIKTSIEAINFRNRYRAKDGSYLLFEWNATQDPITGKFYSSARDITERTKNEEELKNSNDRFLKIFEKNPIGLVLSDLETRKFLDVNETFIETFGYTKEEVIGKTAQELNLIEPTDNEKFKSLILKYGYAKDIEGLARKKNGETFWSLFSVQIFIMNNKKVGLSSFHNITDRKKAEDELKNSNDRFLKIFENNSFGMVLVNLETNKFQYVNGFFLRKFGYTSEEVIGKTPTELKIIEPESYEKVITLFKQQGYVKDFETLVRKKNGEIFWSSSSFQIIKINDVDFFLTSFFDITDRKKAEEEIKQKSEELANTNIELEQFVYVASHDLQEPLRTISNFVNLLEKKYAGNTDKDTEQYLNFIVDAAFRMRNLIKDLLDLSRTGRNVVFSEVDCNEALIEVIANMEASIKEKNAKITFPKLPVLKGDPIKLKQLFQNLISNAIKFVKKDVVPEITITVEEKNTEYLFTIKDNGIGIEEQYFKKLFIIFQRLNAATEYPGTGIGLATCKKIVDLHNGKIWVESKFGEGSTFYFTISKKLN